MNRPALTPAQIIEAARKRLADARSVETLLFESVTAFAAIGVLEDLRLISLDEHQRLRAEFDALADSRRALLEGGAQ